MRLWWLCTTAANASWGRCPRRAGYAEWTGVWRQYRLANRFCVRRTTSAQIANFPLCLAVVFLEPLSRVCHRDPRAPIDSPLYGQILAPIRSTDREIRMNERLSETHPLPGASLNTAFAWLPGLIGGSDKQAPEFESVLSVLPAAVIHSESNMSLAECHSILFVCQKTRSNNLVLINVPCWIRHSRRLLVLPWAAQKLGEFRFRS
jgi:hypothetical protein